MFRVTVAIEIGGRRIRYLKPMGWIAFWRQVLSRAWAGAWRMLIDRTPAAVARDAMLALLAVGGLFLLRNRLVTGGIMSGDNPLDTLIGLIAIGLLIVALFGFLFVLQALFVVPWQMWRERAPSAETISIAADTPEGIADRQHLEVLRRDLSDAFGLLSIALLGAHRLSGAAWPDYPFHNMAKEASSVVSENLALSAMEARIASADYSVAQLVPEMRELMEIYSRSLTTLALMCADLPPTIVLATAEQISQRLPRTLRQLTNVHSKLAGRYLELGKLPGFSGLISGRPPAYWVHPPQWPEWAHS